MRWLVWATVTVVFLGCRDRAAESFARADLQYRALLAEGASTQDARFEAVKRQLEQVPPSSKRYAQAQRLLKALAARAQVRVPLALGAQPGRPPELQAQLAQCARLAAQAGRDGGIDEAAMATLDRCRREAELTELRFAHGDEVSAP